MCAGAMVSVVVMVTCDEVVVSMETLVETLLEESLVMEMMGSCCGPWWLFLR